MDIKTHPVYAQVKIAYADCVENALTEETEATRQLEFRATQAVDPSTACAIMQELVNGYNNFEADCLKLFPDDCQIFLAREGSVCIYVLPGVKKLPTSLQLSADEFDERNGEFRIWWD